ncbi:MAG: AAA family ATPase [Fusobacteriaceae bacterium]|nr:AAA family ATPase [Fusobacteriaceae bacterium]MBN2837669.1 AAA family ATPase [Fusobacteriaceae bacterium]
MELLYVWVEEYGNIRRQGFNFSPNYDINYDPDTKELKCEKKEMQQPKLFGDNISNITAIVGKNGSGKSTLLQIIMLIKKEQSIYKNMFACIFKNYKGKLYSSNKQILTANFLELEEESNFELIYYYDNIDDSIKYNQSYNGEVFSDISTGYLLNPKSSSMESSNKLLYDYHFEELKKQVNFFKDKHNVLKKLPYNKYFESLKSIKTIRVEIYQFSDIKMIKYHEKNVEKIIKKINFKELNKESFAGKLVEELLKRLIYDLCGDESSQELIKDLLDEKKKVIGLNSFLDILNEKQLATTFISNDESIKIIKKILKKESIFKEIHSILNDSIEINFLTDGGEPTQKFNDFINDFQRIQSIFKFRWTVLLSSGELTLLKIMGRFHSTGGNYFSPLILLDEPDTTLHPEWQRNMVAFLNSYFSEIYYNCAEERNKNIQIILTSHSPFIASDLPRENVIMLNTDKDGNCVVKNDKDIKTFGANIFDLYTDAFFVESSFGEFAKGKIKDVVKDLTLNEKGEYSDLSKERIKEIEYIINSIGEKLVSAKLKKLYEEYRNNKNSEEYKKEQLKMLQEKLGLSNEQMINIIKTGDLQ